MVARLECVVDSVDRAIRQVAAESGAFVLRDATITLATRTCRCSYVLVDAHGVLVIHTELWPKATIRGSSRSTEWTARFSRTSRRRFRNPLTSNMRRLEAVNSALLASGKRLPPENFSDMVVIDAEDTSELNLPEGQRSRLVETGDLERVLKARYSSRHNGTALSPKEILEVFTILKQGDEPEESDEWAASEEPTEAAEAAATPEPAATAEPAAPEEPAAIPEPAAAAEPAAPEPTPEPAEPEPEPPKPAAPPKSAEPEWLPEPPRPAAPTPPPAEPTPPPAETTPPTKPAPPVTPSTPIALPTTPELPRPEWRPPTPALPRPEWHRMTEPPVAPAVESSSFRRPSSAPSWSRTSFGPPVAPFVGSKYGSSIYPDEPRVRIRLPSVKSMVVLGVLISILVWLSLFGGYAVIVDRAQESFETFSLQSRPSFGSKMAGVELKRAKEVFREREPAIYAAAEDLNFPTVTPLEDSVRYTWHYRDANGDSHAYTLTFGMSGELLGTAYH